MIGPEIPRDRTGETAPCPKPCPSCGRMKVIAIILTNDEGQHAHTWYLCTYHPGDSRPLCGWSGWRY